LYKDTALLPHYSPALEILLEGNIHVLRLNSKSKHLQTSKKALRLFRSRYRCRRPGIRRKSTQPYITQRTPQRPSLRHIVLHSYISIPQLRTRIPKASHHILYNGIVDKVVQPQSIRILKLELIVVGKEAKEVERGEYLGARVAVLDVLQIVSTS
jgi:hypothetical protein